MREIGNIIKRARQGQGITKKEIQERLRVSPNTLKKWENGLNLKTVIKFLEYLDEIGIDPNMLKP
jgi:transcriptional regulator with XRE-family HTH domain